MTNDMGDDKRHMRVEGERRSCGFGLPGVAFDSLALDRLRGMKLNFLLTPLQSYDKSQHSKVGTML